MKEAKVWATNQAPGGYDMVLSGPFSWTSLGKDVPVSVVPDPNASAKSVIVTTASIAPCMMYWLKVTHTARI